ncbi:MAG TPA: biotin/lipoyl-containing protein, partial [Ktedonobacteraceae bacterium]|nr:biotin/lipoyl-containing protein [Ktedonobacteraceae bacterium]
MATPVTMPRLGESVSEGTIGAWLKQEGDYVGKDESLAEVITDKINAELPSPVAGRLVKILVQVDETVGVGSEIALIEESDDVVTSPSPISQTAAVATPGPDAALVQGAHQAAIPVHVQQSASAPQANGASAVGTATAYAVSQSEEERQRVSPLAKRLAREYGLDLNQVPGTGTGGRVRKEDILAYVEQQAAPAPLPASAAFTSIQSSSLVSPAASSATAGPDEEILIPSRMRMAIAEHMVRSKRTSPHASTMVEVDMTNITKWLEKHKDE